MKTAAVIAEYNPFHNGHLYQLNHIKNELGADYIIVVMSGDFVQRGEPSITDKYMRCRMALQNGADVVFELPVYFSTGSAEYFAQGAVSLLDKLGIVDMLHFGSESGDIGLLCECAGIISSETNEYKEQLNLYLKSGKSFPAARYEAIKSLGVNTAEDIFSNPNNILAIEYIKALKQRNSSITPLTLKRKGTDFNSTKLSQDSTVNFSSANAIRQSLEKRADSNLIRSQLPPSVFDLLKGTLLYPDDFSQMLVYKLLHTLNQGIGFSGFYDVSENLANTIAGRTMDFSSFNDFALLCKSRNRTYTNICRALIHILLDMTQDNADFIKASGYCGYARLLGFTQKSSGILKHIKENSSIPVITSPAKALRQFDKAALISLKADIYASNIYESVKSQKMTCVSQIKNELTREIIKLP